MSGTDSSDVAGGSMTEAAGTLVALARQAVEAYGREDLGPRLEEAAARLADPAAVVLVTGAYKQGKSTLINALLHAPVCPVDDDVATAVPTVVGHGAELAALLLPAPPPAGVEDGAAAAAAGDSEVTATGADATEGPGLLGSPHPVPVDLEDASRAIVAAPDGVPAQRVEIQVPRRLLEGGLRLVDLPGVGGTDLGWGAAARAALPAAHAVLVVSDASQELTASELELVRQARQQVPAVALVVTKTDLTPAWGQVVERDRGHLERVGGGIAVLPVSSVLRDRAVVRGDAELNAVSGYPALTEWLRVQVQVPAAATAAARAGAAVAFVAEQLAAAFLAEREVLTDPDRAVLTASELADAQDRAEALRAAGARWQTVLSDGLADLASDVDHDLRRRFRALTTTVEERIDTVDPARVWDDLDPWIRSLVGTEVEANQSLLVERTLALVGQVAGLFAVEEEELGITSGLLTEVAAMAAAIEDSGDIGSLDGTTNTNVVSSGLGVLRGSYGGMMMFGMLGGVAGITLAAPITLGLGLAMGVKSLRDERTRGLQQRRQQAKAAARRYVDGVSFTVGKESRDALRRIQRELRDTLGRRAQELVRSSQEAVAAAQQAAQADESTRAARLADVEAELARVEALYRHAQALAEPDPDPEPAA